MVNDGELTELTTCFCVSVCVIHLGATSKNRMNKSNSKKVIIFCLQIASIQFRITQSFMFRSNSSIIGKIMLPHLTTVVTSLPPRHFQKLLQPDSATTKSI